MKNWAILQLYCGESGKIGYYNSQEIGLARALVKRDVSVLIVHPDKSLKQDEIQELEPGIRLLKKSCTALGVHSFYSLDFLLENHIDVVHLASDNQLYVSYVQRFCKKHGILQYCYVGTLYSDSENFWKRCLMNLISGKNIRCYQKGNVAVKTASVKEALERSGVKAALIPVGLDLSVIQKESRSVEEVRLALGLPQDKKILLFVGRLEQYKRPLAALELLGALDEAYCLVMIGNGSMGDTIAEKIREYGLEGRVFWKKAVPNVEMSQYYALCDCFVNFNTHEIFGMSILEAMYQKCVVIARKAPGPGFIVEHGVSGYLCETDAEMLAAIKRIPDEAMGERAQQRILEHFTWDQSAELFWNLVYGEDQN